MVNDVLIKRVSAGVTAGTGTKKATIVDMAGYDEVTFIVLFGEVTNTSKVKVQVAQHSTNVTGSMVVTTATTDEIVSDGTEVKLSDKAVALTVNKPLERYLELQTVIGTANAVIDGVIAILGQARTKPVDLDATVQAGEFFLSPVDVS